jgi:hypothetical protein
LTIGRGAQVGEGNRRVEEERQQLAAIAAQIESLQSSESSGRAQLTPN